MKKCNKCKQIKDESEFYKNKAQKDGYCNYCKKCFNEYSKQLYAKDPFRYKSTRQQWHNKNIEKHKKLQKEWSMKNKEEITKKAREWRNKNKERHSQVQRARRIRLKIGAFNAYGGCICVCCGESILEFLSIDHINGGGTKHKKEINQHIYEWLRDNKYPSGFQVLCHNCNQAKGYFGCCPHQKIKEGTYESMVTKS